MQVKLSPEFFNSNCNYIGYIEESAISRTATLDWIRIMQNQNSRYMYLDMLDPNSYI